MQVSGDWHVAHNSFTQISAEGGLPALILYVSILWLGFKNLRTAKRLARGRGQEILLARALCASLAAFVVGSLFATFSYEFFPYMLVAYTTALCFLAKDSALSSRTEKSRRPPRMEASTRVQAADSEMSIHAG